MAQPNWSKIPYDKLPQWKKDELLSKNKEQRKEILNNSLKCDVCGQEAKSIAGLVSHKRQHK